MTVGLIWLIIGMERDRYIAKNGVIMVYLATYVPDVELFMILIWMQRYSDCGKEARALQNYVHTSGAKSYANIRASFEERNNREPSVLEMFRSTHQKKDGTFVKGTVTEDFLDDADANVQTEIDIYSSTKPRVQIENEAFNKLMYEGEIPNRPVGYGFGVKQSDVFGVRSILRKEKFHNGENDGLKLQNMEKKVANLTELNEGLMKQNQDIMKMHNTNQ
ncbi:uncharacterized protein LOC141608291 isoform X1 [Silene latifolia]|uniref:uncharacterized protein LOC141608291 isoform X1 n=1 Tax=Silene latifolia TaxID=37657 RepID=UPI003D78560D